MAQMSDSLRAEVILALRRLLDLLSGAVTALDSQELYDLVRASYDSGSSITELAYSTTKESDLNSEVERYGSELVQLKRQLVVSSSTSPRIGDLLSAIDQFLNVASAVNALHDSPINPVPTPDPSSTENSASVLEKSFGAPKQPRVSELAPPMAAAGASPEPSVMIEDLRASAVEIGEQFTRVKIFDATDRQKAPDSARGYDFTARRADDGQLTFGECEVTIPDSHKMGGFESPAWWRLEFHPNPKKHITLQTVTTVAEDAFLDEVRRRVTESTSKEAFVLAHRYNVSFEDAARRTGQLAYDLNFVGAPILYSWPSNGSTANYSSDEANVIWTSPHLQHLLTLLNTRSGAARIHLVAHSMGNRAVCDALRELSRSTVGLTLPVLHQLVLAAPDIDAGTLKEMAQSIASVSNHTTLYSSSKDKAIALSCGLHRYPRAGGKPVLILPGFETIDASEVDSDWLAHSYFASTWPLLADIYELLRYDKGQASAWL